jgi:hypothetical protein
LAGGAVEVAGKWFALSAGAGAGASGLRVAATARYRLRLGRIFNINISMGAAVSAGPYDWAEPLVFDDPASKHWDTALGANGELGFEIGPPSGFHVRPAVGIGSILIDRLASASATRSRTAKARTAATASSFPT